MEKLKVAIQKSGRLKEDSLQLLKDCGICIENGKDQLKANASGFPLEVFYLRNGDIPKYLIDGVADIAIIGENTLVEKNEKLPVLCKLGFSKCRVSLAVPKNTTFNGLNDFENKRIATSYPHTVEKFFQEKGIKTPETHLINGSVEIAPNIGLADAICDIVSSGSTLFKNNLKEVVNILESQAVLTATPSLTPEKKALLEQLQFRIESVLKGRKYNYILLNAPNEKLDEILNLLPGLRSPTILPLAQKGWSSLHSVIEKSKFWEVIGALKEKGAEDILVSQIEKMVC